MVRLNNNNKMNNNSYVKMKENDLKNLSRSELIKLVMKLNKKAYKKPKPVKPKSDKPKPVTVRLHEP